MSSRNRQTQNQNTSFNNRSTTNWGYFTPPSTPDIDRLRGQEFQIDPSIPYRFGAARSRLRDSFDSPIGGMYSPELRDRITRSGDRELTQQEGQAFREGAFDVNRQNYARNLAVAGMTLPQLVQTGGTASGTGTGQMQQTTSTSPWGSLAGGMGAAASASL